MYNRAMKNHIDKTLENKLTKIYVKLSLFSFLLILSTEIIFRSLGR